MSEALLVLGALTLGLVAALAGPRGGFAGAVTLLLTAAGVAAAAAARGRPIAAAAIVAAALLFLFLVLALDRGGAPPRRSWGGGLSAVLLLAGVAGALVLAPAQTGGAHGAPDRAAWEMAGLALVLVLALLAPLPGGGRARSGGG